MFYWISFIMRVNEGTFYDTCEVKFIKTLISAKNTVQCMFEFSFLLMVDVIWRFFLQHLHVASILKVVKWSASKPKKFSNKKREKKGYDNGTKVLGWGVGVAEKGK